MFCRTMVYNRDSEPFQSRVPIFRHLESQNIWRAKTKKENWAILIAYNITFYHVGSNHKCPLELDRGVNGATQSGDLGGLSYLSASAGSGAEPQS